MHLQLIHETDRRSFETLSSAACRRRANPQLRLVESSSALRLSDIAATARRRRHALLLMLALSLLSWLLIGALIALVVYLAE